jgi:rod shape determining protein RodA
MRAYTRIWRHFDIWLLASVVLLTISGVAMIQSAIAGNETLADTVSKQVIFAITGLIIVIIVAAIDYRIWSALSRPIYIITIIALAFLQIAGEDLFGSTRWFRIGPITIQPSEFAKVFMIFWCYFPHY